MNKKQFYHLKFVRDLDIEDRNKFQRDGRLSKYLLLDYFDFLIFEQAENFEQCALGTEKFACEAEQGLGVFSLETNKENNFPLKNSNNRPFLGILQLTINPIFYKSHDSVNSILELKSSLEEEIVNTLTACDDIMYQIYQTVNAADFCIIVVSKKVDFLERLSKLLKKKCFSFENKKYLIFSIYENMGIHKNINENQLQEACENKHALIARIRVKDYFWNGLQEGRVQDNKNCTLNMLSGRYHFSIRIEGTEFACTMKDIIAYKFEDVLPKMDENLNILQQIMAENKIAYINERVLLRDEMQYKSKNSSEKGSQEIEQPEYEENIKTFEEVRETLKDKVNNQDLEMYLEKIQSLYHMQTKLVRYADTHISVKMFHEYYEAFLNGLLMEIDNIRKADRKDMLDELYYHLKIGLRYLYQFADIIYSINSTTFQAPKYDIVPNIRANPKLSIAYTEYLRNVIDDYRNMRKSRRDDEEQYFPNYIPLIIPEITEGYADFSMLITFPQGFIDNWELDSENWKEYIENGKKTPLFVICQKFQMFANVSDVLTLCFHELGHYCNHLSRKQRNGDLIKMLSNAISLHIIQNLIASEGITYCFKGDGPYFQGRELSFLKNILEKHIIQFLEQELQEYITAPELVFTNKMLDQIKTLLDPKPMYFTQEELEKSTINLFLEKARYNFGADVIKSEEIVSCESFNGKSKNIIENVMKKCNEIFSTYEIAIDHLSFSSNNEDMKIDMKFIIEKSKKVLKMMQEENDYITLDSLTKAIEEKIEKLLGELDNFKTHLPKYIVDFESVKKLEKYCEKIQLLFSVIWEYEKFRKMSIEYTLEKRENAFDKWGKKKTLIQNVCKELKKCLETQDTIQNTFPPTIFETKALSALQLTSDMNQKRLFDKLSQIFLLRTQDIDDMMNIISSTYAEGFADLFMCKELNFGVKEYLIVIAKYVRGFSELDNALRLNSISTVVLVLMMEEEAENDFSVIFNNYLKKGIHKVFNSKNQDFFKQIENICYDQEDFWGDNFPKKLLKLKCDIEKSLSLINNDSFMILIISRMYEKASSYKRLESSKKVEFVKDSLNEFIKGFFENEIQKETSCIMEREIIFLRKYYYKNRIRYMKGYPNG